MTATAGARAVVVGAGVSGLTTGVVLAEAGWKVTVTAERMWDDTTSRVAGAVWEPYLSGGARVERWAAATYDAFAALADDAPGVTMGELVEGGPRPAEIPAWARAASGTRALRPDELRPGWASGFCCQVPMVHMGRYLPYLAERLVAAGGTFRSRRIGGFAELAPAELVVNCSGLGSVELAGDTEMRPVRGQVVVVENPGLQGAVIVAEEGVVTTYRIAHHDEVVLGGTADVDCWDLDADPEVAAGILERAATLDPDVTGAAVLDHRVGLRPWRPEVRVEADPNPPGGVILLIHNYGHGGSGITLSWGCAYDVAGLAGVT